LLQEKDSFAIYHFLEEQNLLKNSPKYWWPNGGTFEVVIGAILTQNTTWKNVEKSLKNLKGFLELESFLSLSEEQLKEKIRPSGFYNQKAPRLLRLSKNMQADFKDFQTFQKEVSREWLLSQKGIGEESADAILCYACFYPTMVVDTYTKRLLKKFGIEFQKYGDYKSFLEEGLKIHYKKDDLNIIYMKFHGMIVEYNKLKQT